MGLVERGLTTRDLITDASIENAMVMHAAFGGSTNLLLHLVDRAEAAALCAGTGGFHRRVEGQDVGLEGDAVNGAEDLADAAGGGADLPHRVHDVVHHRTAAFGHLGVGAGHVGGLQGVLGGIIDWELAH